MKNDYNVFLCYRGEGSVLASSIYHELNTYSKDKLKLFYAPKCHPEDTVRIFRSPYHTNLIRIKKGGFLSALRKKLS